MRFMYKLISGGAGLSLITAALWKTYELETLALEKTDLYEIDENKGVPLEDTEGNKVKADIAVCQGPHITGYPFNRKFNYQSDVIPAGHECSTSQRISVDWIKLHMFRGRSPEGVKQCDHPDGSKLYRCAHTIKHRRTRGAACQETEVRHEGKTYKTERVCGR